MNILDDYKQLLMIDNIKNIKCYQSKITELEAENRSLKAYIKILENNKEVAQCENP